MSDLDLAAIRERWSKTTPGPWFWWGNTDNGNEALCGRQPGLGVCEVLSQVEVERTADSPGAKAYREYLYDSSSSGEPRQGDDEDEAVFQRRWEAWADQTIHDEWLTDQWGEPVKDERIALTDGNYIRRAVHEVAVYQVARGQGLPEDTPRDHPKVYRADICDVRNDNGRALASAWGDVHALLAEVERLQALLRLRDPLNDTELVEQAGLP